MCWAIKSCWEKKQKKNIFLPGQPFLVQIFSKYFNHHFHLKILCKIFDAVLRQVLNSSPQFIHILPAHCLKCNWFLVNLAAAVDCVQLVPKYYSKVKLRSWQSPNISVWNNETSGKWGRWWKFGSNLWLTPLHGDSCISAVLAIASLC